MLFHKKNDISDATSSRSGDTWFLPAWCGRVANTAGGTGINSSRSSANWIPASKFPPSPAAWKNRAVA